MLAEITLTNCDRAAHSQVKRMVNVAAMLGLWLATTMAWAASADLAIWFDRPASDWEQYGLPIGNGAMGAVIMGEPVQEVIQFNEKTLWTGGPDSKGGYDFGIPKQPQTHALKKVQQQLNRTGAMSPEAVAEQLGRPIIGYGDYQNFGELILDFDDKGPVKNYRRELNLAEGKVMVSYQQGGVNHRREYFASYPDGVIVVRVSADQPGQVSLAVGLQIPDNRSAEFSVSEKTLLVRGALKDNGLIYSAGVALQLEGGEQVAVDSPAISSHYFQPYRVRNADAMTLLLTAGTDYAQQYPDYRGAEPLTSVTQRLKSAQAQSAKQLAANHQADYQSLYNSMTLDIGQQPSRAPTDILLAGYNGEGVAARTLEATYFQFGRYLLIASSRPGSLPANLQGVWNHSNNPPWNADYHVNINLQMNYWPAYVTNLAETTAPLYDFIDSLVEPGRHSAANIVGAQGWTLFLNTNIWGFTGVIQWPTAFWQPEAAAWLMQHYYEHYRFTGDVTFLRQRAYPIMKEAVHFWLDALVTDPRDNALVVSPSYSPEHGDFTVGAAMSQQIVHELFQNTLTSARLLNDKPMMKTLEKALLRLDRGLRIGRWGQLQEWKADLDDPESQHRHISHLYALHPGNQIAINREPALMQAARRSLNARGDGGTGWAQAWKVNLWARLHDGNRAHKLLRDQLTVSTLPNLWDNHPPFQIDGNFGATAGIAEMLLQSHDGVVHLLPALPRAWPAGQVDGLRARGNVTLGIDWDKGEITEARLQSHKGGALRFRVPPTSKTWWLIHGDSRQKVEAKNERILTFDVAPQVTYQLVPYAKEDSNNPL